MKVVHFESGLGNQMLDYVDYLLVRHANPSQDVLVEKLIFDIRDSHDVISMWNGFELDRVFGLCLSDVEDRFDEVTWSAIREGMRQSRFWEKGWNYSEELVFVFRQHGLSLENTVLRVAPLAAQQGRSLGRHAIEAAKNTRLGGSVRGAVGSLARRRREIPHVLYEPNSDDEFCGHSLMGMFRGFGIENVRDELLRTFTFPTLSDDRNCELEQELGERNAVSIHARRGDYLGINGFCYKNGYFKRATRFIKRRVEEPLFVFFADRASVLWLRENMDVFGLTIADDIRIVDWNLGNDSFRDMQLMSLCKHNIVTQSSFGWWGSYLNANPNKITIAPNSLMISTHCM